MSPREGAESGQNGSYGLNWKTSVVNFEIFPGFDQFFCVDPCSGPWLELELSFLRIKKSLSVKKVLSL